MQECYEENIVEQYRLEIDGIRKVRGAALCETRQGLYLLREVPESDGRIPVLNELYEHLADQGYEQTDRIIPNKAGDLISGLGDGSYYIMKQWFPGRECDIRKTNELLEAAGNLAKLHRIMRAELAGEVAVAEPLPDIYLKHDRELKKVRRFVRKQCPKGEFEFAFLQCFDQMYEWACAAEDILQNSEYDRLYEDSIKEGCMIHGEYNYHNVLMRREGSRPAFLATVNFDKFRRDVQVEDLYYFLRKVMEKHGWKERLGDNMLNAYSAIRPLSGEEIEYVKLKLVYPEKFWKTASAYYHSNKAWISVKNIEKLKLSIRQTKEKKQFLETVFGFRL